MQPQLIIPPKDLMTQTGGGDPVFFHYFPVVGYVYRKRLANTFKLISPFYFNKVIEVGYGSGIFLPTLAKISQKLWALDIHPQTHAVKKLLQAYQLKNVTLTRGDIVDIPFPKAFFDACVVVSVLEDMNEAALAVAELQRILKPNGHLFVSFPIANVVTDTFFRLLGENPRTMHPSSHQTILRALNTHFQIEEVLTFPKRMPLQMALYASIHCRNY